MYKKKFISLIILILFIIAFITPLHAFLNPSHFQNFHKTTSWCSYTGKINLFGVSAVNNEDEVGAFVNDGNGGEILIGACVMGQVVSEYYFITLYGDDSTTNNKDGAYTNEELIFKVWDKSANQEYLIPSSLMEYENIGQDLKKAQIPPIWADSMTFGLLNLSKNDNEHYIISASSGINGNISPSGNINVKIGDSQAFIITPAEGFQINELTINGESTQITNNNFTLNNVYENKKIHISFKPIFPGDKNNYPLTNRWCSYAGKIENSQDGEDIIGVFTSDETGGEILVGKSIIGNIVKSFYFVDVYGDDTSTEIKDGAYENDNLIFKFWDKSENKIHVYSANQMYVQKYEFLNTPVITPKWSESFTFGLLHFNKIIPYYSITSSSSSNGEIFPCGIIDNIISGSYKKFSIIADQGFYIYDVLVNGKSMGNIEKYVFKDISSNNTIHAEFKPIDKPDANFDADYSGCYAPLKIQFFDKSIGNVFNWIWDFGDGIFSSAKNPVHAYNAAGNYKVKLYVEGPGGKDVEIKTDFINVCNNKCDIFADFWGEPRYIVDSNAKVEFHSKTYSNLQLHWDFGDGTTSSQQNPVHIYNNTGKFNITLTVSSEACSKTITKQSYIQVDLPRTISGKISDSKGNPLNSCFVEARSSDNHIIGTSKTDNNGNYLIKRLKPLDNIKIGAFPSLFNNRKYIRAFYKNSTSWDNAETISTINGDLQNINIRLFDVPDFGITGRVYDKQSNSGFTNVEVVAFSNKYCMGNRSKTDESGYYTITGLEYSNDYVVSVWLENKNEELYYSIPEDEIPGNYIPDSSSRHFQKATYISSQNPYISNIDLIWSNGESIKGRVMADSKPVSNIWVNAWSSYLKEGNYALTDESGNYTITGLTKVTGNDILTMGYIVEASTMRLNNKWMFSRIYYNNAVSPENATLVGTGSESIDFQIITSLSISGKITGAVLENIEVAAWSPDLKQEVKTLSDSNGYYTLTHLQPASDYIVAIFPPESPVYYYNSNTSTSERLNADLIDLSSKNVNNINFDYTLENCITGKVFIEDNLNSASEGIWVNISSETLNSGFEAPTDENGIYKYCGLNSSINDYIVSIWQPDYLSSFYNNNGTVYDSLQAEKIQAPKKDCDLILKSGYKIYGNIKYDNSSISGIVIEACLDSQSEELTSCRTTVSNANSNYNYEIKGLTPGDYKVFAFPPEKFQDTNKDITITNSDQNLNFELQSSSRKISGKINNLEQGKEVIIIAWSDSTKILKISQKIIGNDLNNASYSIEGLKPARDYIVELNSKAYQTQFYKEKTYFLHSNPVNILDSNADNIDFTVTKYPASISGTITFPESAKSGETVWILASSESTASKASTFIKYKNDTNVNYEITGLKQAKDYIVSIYSERYKITYYNGKNNSDEADYVDTSDEISDDSINFELFSGNTISGKVTKGQKDISGVLVMACSKSIGFQCIETNTMSNGTFIIEGLEKASDYIVSVEIKDISEPFYYKSDGITRDQSIATTISTFNYENGSGPDNINFSIDDDNNTINGVVYDRQGKLLSGILIVAESEILNVRGSSFTKNDGSYEIKHLPKGCDYNVSAIPSHSLSYKSGILKAICTDTKVDFILIQGYEISGTIFNQAGYSIPGTFIEIWSDSEKIFKNVTADISGNFLIGGLNKADDYNIVISPPDNLQYAKYIEKNIVINADLEKNFILDSALNISGTIFYISENNEEQITKTIKNANITAYSNETGFVGTAISNRDGFYEITNVPQASDYIITAIHNNYAKVQKNNQSPGSVVDLYLEYGGSITGYVTDSSNIPVQNVKIIVNSPSLNLLKNTTTDKNGYYCIKGLPGKRDNAAIDDYIVYIEADNYPDQSKGQKQVGDNVNFVLIKSSDNEISGTIKDSEGNKPPENLKKIVVSIYEEGAKMYEKKETTDTNGNFSFTGLDSNKLYQIKVKAYGSNLPIEKQWSGPGDTGQDKRSDAKTYNTNTTVDFKFSGTW